MGILDEAIRQHLELKRQHGAAESELRQLEDEAFGAAERPGTEGGAGDALAEAPTEFLAAPATAGESSGRREPPSIADLQEAPPSPAPPGEEQPAAEHEAVPSSEAGEQGDRPPSATEERQAIAEQPTQHFDVEEELAATEKRGPSDEELVEQEVVEPRLAPVDPLPDAEPEQPGEVEVSHPGADAEPEEDEDDAFWNEQRLSEELDQALEAPLAESSPQTAEHELAELDEAEEAEAEHRPQDPTDDSDVLEATPEFLEDAPEDDQLWFEQKPPKDFDFDD